MKNIIFWILKCAGFIVLLGIFSGCATISDRDLSAEYHREPIFIDAKDRQGCKIAHFFSQIDDKKPLNEKIAIALNVEESWDGECKDGYANGIGAEITEGKDGIKRTLIAVYTDRIPRYVYLYESNGYDYAMFMGAFGDIFNHIENNYKYGLVVKSDGNRFEGNYGKRLSLQTLRADIVFDMTYSNDRRLSVNGYELRDILLMPQKEEYKHALMLMRDYKKDLLQSIANYGESLVIVQQYKNKVCGESNGEFVADLANQNANSGAIHHNEICEIKINYTTEMEIMQKLIDFLSEL